MNPERWQQVDELFQAVLQRPRESRMIFLLEACHSDDALRQEVEELLAAYEAADSFLEKPAGESFGFNGKPAHGSSLTAGQKLAHFRSSRRSALGAWARSISPTT